MRRVRVTMLISTALLLLMAAAPALAGKGACCKRGMPAYDVKSEVTLNGTVEKIEQIDCCCPMGKTGVHLKLKTGEATVQVHVGPSWFLEERDFALAEGDRIEIVGSKVTMKGQDALLARQVKRGDRSLTLRDAAGTPEWTGGLKRG